MKTAKYSIHLLLLTSLIAALGWIFSKETVRELPPFAFISSRFILAAILLMPFCRQAWQQTSLGDVIRSAGVGLLLGSALLCWIHAIAISTALGQGAFIMSLSMLMVPIIAWLIFKTPPAKWFWISLPFAIVGLLLLAYVPNEPWQLSAGQFWFACAAILLALHFNANSFCARVVPPLLLTTIQLMMTGLLAAVASWAFETLPQSLSPQIWAWFMVSTLIATSLRYLLQTTGQKHVATASAAFIMILEPVWTLALSVWVYAEHLSIANQIGCGLILFALLLYRAPGVYRQWALMRS